MLTGKTINSLLLLLLPIVVQAAPITLPQLMAQFSAVESRRADYAEKQYLAMLEIPLESHGTLTFHAPDILEKISTDGGNSYRIEGEQLQIQQNGEQHQISLNNYPALAAFVASFRATLAGDQQTLQRYYHITLSGVLNDWTLLLEPKQDEIAVIIRTITMHGSYNRVRLIETVERSGDSSQLKLSERNEK